ncbi:MAG: MlaE family ABC transporter permease [Solirubrobacteraceae bacterium]
MSAVRETATKIRPLPPDRSAQPVRRRVIVFGEISDFFWRVTRNVPVALRGYFTEVLRQSTILARGSVMIVMVMVFAFGLVTGITSAYGARLVGAPSLAALGPSVGGLRELTPYAFAYMMAAKVSTGYVAEIGTMRITDEIDALEVMGLNTIAYICSTRVIATWVVLPLIYGLAVVVGYIGGYIAIVLQVGQTSPGGYLTLFWEFQSPSDLLFSAIKGMLMGTFVVLVGVYYGFKVRGGPVEVGSATARAMIVNLVGVHLIGVMTSQAFWASNPRVPIGG